MRCQLRARGSAERALRAREHRLLRLGDREEGVQPAETPRRVHVVAGAKGFSAAALRIEMRFGGVRFGGVRRDAATDSVEHCEQLQSDLVGTSERSAMHAVQLAPPLAPVVPHLTPLVKESHHCDEVSIIAHAALARRLGGCYKLRRARAAVELLADDERGDGRHVEAPELARTEQSAREARFDREGCHLSAETREVSFVSERIEKPELLGGLGEGVGSGRVEPVERVRLGDTHRLEREERG